MARRATELNEDAKFRLNGINNLERVFRGALARISLFGSGCAGLGSGFWPFQQPANLTLPNV